MRCRKTDSATRLRAGLRSLSIAASCPVLIGPSRKRFIGELTAQQTPANRVGGTIAACLTAWRRGASIFRVHDVGAVRQALTVAGAIEKTNSHENSRC